MPEEIENLMVRDDWWNDKNCKDESYYDDMPDYLENE